MHVKKTLNFISGLAGRETRGGETQGGGRGEKETRRGGKEKVRGFLSVSEVRSLWCQVHPT